MVAANPSRVSPTFNETALRYVVDMISTQTNWLLEIVNFNVENSQYVCAGHLNALDCLSNVLNFLKQQKIDMQKLMATLSLEEVKQRLSEIVDASAEKSRKKADEGPMELERGYATIPLKAIDVPFHSTFLRNGVRPFRGYLSKKILRSQINPSLLLNRYIPNVTAKPFSISREYIEEVHKLTGSPKLATVLNNWSRYQQGNYSEFNSKTNLYRSLIDF
jgi:fatty acid synthase subunit beta, fungi type